MKLIETTKYRKIPTEKSSKLFWMADNSTFVEGIESLKKIEAKIRAEYPLTSDKEYCAKRIEFLKTNIGLFDKKVDENLLKLIKHCEDIYKK